MLKTNQFLSYLHFFLLSVLMNIMPTLSESMSFERKRAANFNSKNPINLISHFALECEFIYLI